MKIPFAIAEDHRPLAESIRDRLLRCTKDLECRYIARNGEELLSFLKKENDIKVVLMDIEMPGMDGIATTEAVRSEYPHIYVIMLTVFDDDDKILRAIQAGANGYLLKDDPAEEIVRGIRMILDGGAPMSPTIAAKTLNILRTPLAPLKAIKQQDFSLSKREIQILEHLKDGFDYKQIADLLFISPATVRKHIENVYGKLRVHNKMQAVQKALQHRII